MTNPKDRDRLIEADRAWRDKVASVEARAADGKRLCDYLERERRQFEAQRERWEKFTIEIASEMAKLVPDDIAPTSLTGPQGIVSPIAAEFYAEQKADDELVASGVTTAADAARMRAEIMQEARKRTELVAYPVKVQIDETTRACPVCHHEHLVGPLGSLVCGGDSENCYCKAEDHDKVIGVSPSNSGTFTIEAKAVVSPQVGMVVSFDGGTPCRITRVGDDDWIYGETLEADPYYTKWPLWDWPSAKIVKFG